MGETELCPLCGVPLDDAPGPVHDGDCPVHGVVHRLRGVDDHAPVGLLGREASEGLSVYPEPFGETLPVGTAGWRLVDELDVLDPDSAARHGFEVSDEIDSFRSRQKLRYPDGTVVEDQGVAHEGGQARWTLLGLEPGHDLLMIERTDVVYAGGDLELTVAGRRPIVFPDFAADRRYRWRNRAIPIPGAWVDGDAIEVTLRRVDSTADLSHFRVWVYQSRTPDPEAPVGGGGEEGPFETVDIPASSLIEPPERAPAPLVDEGPEDDDLDGPTDDSLVDEPAGLIEAPPTPAPEPQPAPQPQPQPEAAPAPDAAPEASADAITGSPAPAIEQAAQQTAEPAPEPSRPARPARQSAPPAKPAPATAEPGAARQKLVTITLAAADAPHGTPTEHLAAELAAGWRIERLECVPGSGGGWLVVLLAR